MNESIRNMKNGQKLQLRMDWSHFDREEETYGKKGDIFIVVGDQKHEHYITLQNPNNKYLYEWSLNFSPTWKIIDEHKEFTDEEYEELLV